MKRSFRRLFTAVLAAASILCTVTVWAAAEHEHKWQYSGSSDESCHGLQCTECFEYLWEAHTFGGDGKCTFCGYEPHEHNWKYSGYYDDSLHGICCDGCGDYKYGEHSYDGVKCTFCGYEVHVHTWEYSGEIDDFSHGLYCKECNGISSEYHTFGSDGYCTVCGAAPAHLHEWKYNGINEYYYHCLACTGCEETMTEEHIWAWDGRNRTDRTHILVCKVCKYSIESFHWFDDIGRCNYCGYERVYHSWEYNDYYEDNVHEMICVDCGSIRNEVYSAGSDGNCTVCGLHICEPAEPEYAEPEPTQPKPTEPETIESMPAVAESAKTESIETEPAEPVVNQPDPAESKPKKPAPDKSATEEPAATEPTSEAPSGSNTDGSKNTVLWTAVALVPVLGVCAVALIRKRKKT